MKSNVENHAWHDAILLDVRIDRENPGAQDRVDISVEWIDGATSVVSFIDCYLLICRMNFGIVASETIRSFEVTRANPEIREIQESFGLSEERSASLRCYRIETNSTASVLQIFACGAVMKS